MENRRLSSPALPDDLELIGEGISFTGAMRCVLAHTDFFANFAQADINTLVTYMHAYRAREGVTIFHEGVQNGYLCVLTEGRIGVYKKGDDGQYNTISTIHPGKAFGEISLVDDHPYSVNLVAEAKSTLILMSRENFRHCVNRNPVLGVRLLRRIAQQFSLRLLQTGTDLDDLLHI